MRLIENLIKFCNFSIQDNILSEKSITQKEAKEFILIYI